jgi:Xaa-Pro aminopeptidase
VDNSSGRACCERRIGALVAGMRERGVDLVLLFDRDDVRYFTGFRVNRVVSSILAVSAAVGPTHIVARLDFDRARQDGWIDRVIPFPEDTPNPLEALRPLLQGVSRIGVERSAVTLDQAAVLRAIAPPKHEIVDIRDLTSELRLVKSAEELDTLRRSAHIASEVMAEIQKAVRPGVCEVELSSWAEHLIGKAGGEGPSFEPFLMSGKNAWLPQRFSSQKRLQDGELALLDMGAIVDGYCSDITRTFAIGEISREQERLFDVARAAHDAGVAGVRPGATAGEVDRAARTVIEAAGLGERFPHLTGHGIGISPHEGPIADRGVETVLEPGMVLTIEPGIYVPGVGAARIEDMVAVTGDGCEVLTDAPRGLRPGEA